MRGAYLLLTQPLYQSERVAGAAFRYPGGAQHRSHDEPDPAARARTSTVKSSIPTPNPAQPRCDPRRDQARGPGAALPADRREAELSDARKLDHAAEAFCLPNLVVDVGLQSDVLNISLSSTPIATMARDTVQAAARPVLSPRRPRSTPIRNWGSPRAKPAKARDKLTEAQKQLTDVQVAASDRRSAAAGLAVPAVADRCRKPAARRAGPRRWKRSSGGSALKQLLEIRCRRTSPVPRSGEQYPAADAAEGAARSVAREAQPDGEHLPIGQPSVPTTGRADRVAVAAVAKQRTGEARGRSATQPNMVYQSIKTDLSARLGRGDQRASAGAVC